MLATMLAKGDAVGLLRGGLPAAIAFARDVLVHRSLLEGCAVGVALVVPHVALRPSSVLHKHCVAQLSPHLRHSRSLRLLLPARDYYAPARLQMRVAAVVRRRGDGARGHGE